MSSVKLDKNLAKMIWLSEIGFVSSNSMVPPLRSSANERIVMAGTKNRNKNLDILKSPCKSANPEYKTLLMFGKTHINKPARMRKTPIKMYPNNELKYDFSSFK